MSDKKTLGVILSGCGVYDGAEIHEAVICLLALDEAGVDVKLCAPDIALEEIDHTTGEPTGQQRRVLAEAARIARGKIENLAHVQGTDVDGWVLPGGFGAAKNLSDFAKSDVARVVREALAAQLPVGACCIAPAVLAAITRSSGPKLKLTVGDKDPETASALQSMGAEHVAVPVEQAVVDEAHKVVTAPAYMDGDASIGQVAAGIRKMIQQVVEWA
jgi:enhancing lycopene biosynthesis protein 2